LFQAELVAMMLRWLPEDITVHNEDLEGNDEESELFALLIDAFFSIFAILILLFLSAN